MDLWRKLVYLLPSGFVLHCRLVSINCKHPLEQVLCLVSEEMCVVMYCDILWYTVEQLPQVVSCCWAALLVVDSPV